MARTLTLKYKILLLISIPLLLQLSLLATVACLQNQAEDEARRAENSRRIADEVFDITRDLVSTKATYGSSETIPDTATPGKTPAELIASIDRHFANLRELTKNKPLLSERMDHAFESIKETERLLHETRIQYKADLRSGTQHLSSLLRLQKLTYKISNQLLDLADAGKAIADASPEKQRIFREQVQFVLIAGGIANIVLTIILAVILGQSIVARLTIMNDNNYLLASDKPLHKPVSGNDEISRLDVLFHQMADALRDAERKEKAILNNVNDCICSLDSSLKFVNCNPAAQHFFGISAEEIIFTRFSDYLSDKDRKNCHEFLSNVKQGLTSESLAVTLHRTGGEALEILFSAQWVPTEGKEGEWFCIFHDITERRAIERLKQELVAMITHDLRTPLTTVQNFLEFLSDGSYGDPGDEAKLYLPGAVRSSQRMMTLIGDLLDIEKINSGMMQLNLSNVSLQRIFDETVEQTAGISSEMGVILEVEPTSIHVEADHEKLLRIIANLLSNSLKFSPRGGKISLSASLQEHSKVLVTVADQGPGIPEQMLETIFDRFQQAPNQTARTQGGSGLGLAICKALVSLHGGKIWAESTPGKGSLFSFELPSTSHVDVA